MTGRGLTRLRRWALAGLAALVVLWGLSHAGTALVVFVPLEQPDVIVSLASHEWERLPLAGQLARKNPEARVVLTLPPEVTEHNCYNCDGRLEWLEGMGVESSRISVIPIALDGTFGEAAAVRDYVQEEGLHRLVVVTSPYHTRRTLATFRAALEDSGVQLGVHPAATTSPSRPEAWWKAAYDRGYVAYEWAATVFYLVRHGVFSMVFMPENLR